MNAPNHEDMLFTYEDVNGNIQKLEKEHIKTICYVSMQLSSIFQDNRTIKIKGQ